MSERESNEYLIGQSIAAVVIFVTAAALLPQSLAMPGLSGMLPIAMLVALMGLSLVLGVRTFLGYRRGALGGRLFVNFPLFALAVVLSIIYVVIIPIIGFYPATAILIPVMAVLFGYRRPIGLTLATVLFVGGLALIFHTVMQRSFPGGMFFGS